MSQNPISNANALYFDMMRIQGDCYESRPARLESTAEINEQLLNTNKVHVYPNPFKDELTIVSEFELQKIELFQSNGVLVFTEDITAAGKEFNIETNQLMNGVYFLHATSPKGKEIIKILK